MSALDGGEGAGLAQWYSAGLWAGNFSVHHRIQTGSGSHTPSCAMGKETKQYNTQVTRWGRKSPCRFSVSPEEISEVKRPERKTNHSFTSGAEMRGAILPLPQYAFMTLCSVKRKHRGYSFTRCRGVISFILRPFYPRYSFQNYGKSTKKLSTPVNYLSIVLFCFFLNNHSFLIHTRYFVTRCVVMCDPTKKLRFIITKYKCKIF